MSAERKTAIVTGGTAGIGLETARHFVRIGWRVIITGRDNGRLDAAAEELSREPGNGDVATQRADFAELAQVRDLAGALDAEPRIDVLLNNAGVALSRRRVSHDGNEMMLQVNHLAPFLLTNLLLGKIKASAPARIVNVASRFHRMTRTHGFEDFQFERYYNVRISYARTKLYAILFTRELSRRMEGTGVTANALHPGSIQTDIGGGGDIGGVMGFLWPHIQAMTMRPISQAARVPSYVTTAPELETVSGKYFASALKPVEPSDLARDVKAARHLWALSARMVGLNEADDSH